MHSGNNLHSKVCTSPPGEPPLTALVTTDTEVEDVLAGIPVIGAMEPTATCASFVATAP